MGIRGYFDLFLVALILLLVCAGLWLWRDKDNAKAQLIAAQATIGVQATQIADDGTKFKQLAAYKNANDAILAKLITAISGIEQTANKLNGDISNLRRTNADVEKFLSTPIPVALLCLLNGMCPQGTAAAAANK